MKICDSCLQHCYKTNDITEYEQRRDSLCDFCFKNTSCYETELEMIYPKTFKTTTERMIHLLNSRCRTVNIHIDSSGNIAITAIGRTSPLQTFAGESVMYQEGLPYGYGLNKALWDILIRSEDMYFGNKNEEENRRLYNITEYR